MRAAMAQKIEKRLRPDGGWWKSDTARTVRGSAAALLDSGISEEMTVDILEDLISAIRSEYGE